MAVVTVVGPGEPDRACDLVAASVVEAYLLRDPKAEVQVRVTGGRGVLFVAGEARSSADFDIAASVKQALAAAGVMGSIEPFLALETLHPSWGQTRGVRTLTVAESYATSETPELWPATFVLTRKLTRLLEEKRQSDPDWFWLGADYEVSFVDRGGRPPLICVRAEHLEARSLEQVRDAIRGLFAPHIHQAELRVNATGKETEAGLAFRMGASGQCRTDAASSRTLSLPGVGLPLRHPQVLGTQLCRAVARRLAREGKSSAVMVRATWLPFETRAAYARAWSETGAELTDQIKPDELDLERAPSTWLAPELATARVRAFTDARVILPWELC